MTVILHNTLPGAGLDRLPRPDRRAGRRHRRPQPERDGQRQDDLADERRGRDGGTVTYSFVADRPGTFLYESGTNPEKQVRMGLFGALIVRPALGADYAYNRADSQFTPARSSWCCSRRSTPTSTRRSSRARRFNLNNYHPRYWLINGRGFPDSIADNGASWLPAPALRRAGADPSVRRVEPTRSPALARYLNVGHRGLPLPPARQQRPGDRARRATRSRAPAARTCRSRSSPINVGPGQTWDVLFKWYDAEDYDPVATRCR